MKLIVLILSCSVVWLNVSPGFTGNNRTDSASANSKASRQRSFACLSEAVNLSDFDNLRAAKFGVPPIFTFRDALRVGARSTSIARCLPTFLISVVHVVLKCAYEKMSNVAAFWIIAGVQNVRHVGRNLAVSQHPHYSVGRDIENTAIKANSQASIPIFLYTFTKPVPAIVNPFIFNFRPQSFKLLIGKLDLLSAMPDDFFRFVIHNRAMIEFSDALPATTGAHYDHKKSA